MPAAESTVELFLALGLISLALFSINLILLSVARILLPRRLLTPKLPAENELPLVLVQIPLYNESELVERILNSILALDWPHDRLQIQVLDDSSDGSLAISRRVVNELSQTDVMIELRHRMQRTAFKAGALAAGLRGATAPFVAIFDADFLPPPDFLRRTVAILFAHPELAYVQARWEHLNRDENLLTHVQARLLDSHFRVEQEARWRLGLPVPFNGTGGVWRRTAIEDAGGWEGDTLSEDLDLSLRVHLKGWKSAFLNNLTVPSVLPNSARAWQVQQFRWTKGFIQCLLKLLPKIWTSSVLLLWQKFFISLQLAQPLAFVIGVCCLILGLPFISGTTMSGAWLSHVAFLTSCLGFIVPIIFLTLAGFYDGIFQTGREILGALILTSGLLLSNARGAIEALLGYRSEFIRTPKTRLQTAQLITPWRNGLIEFGAGLSLLGFILFEQPIAVFYMAMLITGLLGIGMMQMLDGRILSKQSNAQRQQT